MLRGSYSARIDDKGRLKLPNAFKALVEEQHGTELYLTSLSGDFLRVYPMAVWKDVEERLAAMPALHPAKVKFLDRVSYFGQVADIDGQGRVLVPARLRESAGIVGDVDVLGQLHYLDVWNHDRFLSKLQRESFTDDDARALAEFGI